MGGESSSSEEWVVAGACFRADKARINELLSDGDALRAHHHRGESLHAASCKLSVSPERKGFRQGISVVVASWAHFSRKGWMLDAAATVLVESRRPGRDADFSTRPDVIGDGRVT